MVSSALISVNLPTSAVKNIKLMEPPVDRIRLSQTGKDQLSKLKRSTKIDSGTSCVGGDFADRSPNPASHPQYQFPATATSN